MTDHLRSAWHTEFNEKLLAFRRITIFLLRRGINPNILENLFFNTLKLEKFLHIHERLLSNDHIKTIIEQIMPEVSYIFSECPRRRSPNALNADSLDLLSRLLELLLKKNLHKEWNIDRVLECERGIERRTPKMFFMNKSEKNSWLDLYLIFSVINKFELDNDSFKVIIQHASHYGIHTLSLLLNVDKADLSTILDIFKKEPKHVAEVGDFYCYTKDADKDYVLHDYGKEYHFKNCKGKITPQLLTKWIMMLKMRENTDYPLIRYMRPVFEGAMTAYYNFNKPYEPTDNQQSNGTTKFQNTM